MAAIAPESVGRRGTAPPRSPKRKPCPGVMELAAGSLPPPGPPDIRGKYIKSPMLTVARDSRNELIIYNHILIAGGGNHIQRLIMNIFVDKDACVGCGLCVKDCPMHV